MPGLLIIAHSPLASALKAVAGHVYPDSTVPLEALDVAPDMSPEEIEAQASVLLARVRGPDALILTDVFSATPCNVAQQIADGVGVRVVTGVNVPMLWRSMCYAAEPLDALVTRALAGATQGAMQVGLARPRSQAADIATDDQDQRDDQQ